MKKRAIGEITGPYRFMQLLWVVLAHPEYDWDVVVRYVDGSAEAVDDLAKRCEMSGLFKNVYKCMESTLFASTSQKIKSFMKLGFYYATFRKQKYFDKLIIDTIGTNDYQLYCAENTASMFGCALIRQHKHAPVLLLEDGNWEYGNWDGITMDYGNSFVMKLVGSVFFKLGIVNFMFKHNFKLNKYCIKYATRPGRLIEKNFREVRELYRNPKGLEKYRKIVSKIYDIKDLNCDVIVFGSITASNEKDEDILLFMKWLEEEYAGKKVIMKTHPLDVFDYKSDKVDLEVMNKMVPGELFFSVINDDAEMVFTAITTMMMSIPEEKRIRVIHFDPDMMFNTYESSFKEGLKLSSTDKIDIVEIKG